MRRHQRPDQETELDLTPMLDVVFIMLIFFIVTTSFVKEAGITVNTPEAETAQRQESANILIGIEESGSIWIDGRPIDVRALKATVARLHAENPQGTVVVQSDEKADTGVLVKVMDQVRLAGIDKIAVASRVAPP
ncbi:MAG: biopolymer transporter ExbD [Pseudomonadales bacterium]|uniref:ExbD/TolR family protein n=1 Tax=unclassified Ketobacter TaxID=2639109 RepID=UPI000C65E1A6|nr:MULTISPECIES: biopolymer transporter ExbD [unclassified Ketobacter]MAA60346.1 biopolymer transporter ExbD [Pseudomonadales bacterium]MEC8809727.1 biopolymer transporter ExbD [Pseudomonadota bacterium]TNC90673.1 MAG: biopolymer transporter ExbD [Alcanivorax sp.]HAG93745.1 biopolymer transporter ExbD [Gammaproteobacteria bacterium]MAQ25614.1 biopolymer transporter ExbD [Pseudomonadales bacterium]